MEGPAAAPVFDEALQDTLLATATAAAIGSSLAVGDATEVLLQLRIDSMLPLMSTLEVRTLFCGDVPAPVACVQKQVTLPVAGCCSQNDRLLSSSFTPWHGMCARVLSSRGSGQWPEY